jgi:hypothetical protein
MFVIRFVLPLPDDPESINENGNLGNTPDFATALCGILDLAVSIASIFNESELIFFVVAIVI